MSLSRRSALCISLILLAACSKSTGEAQGSIAGNVVINGEPDASGVLITAQGPTVATSVSSSFGDFVLAGLQPGSYTLYYQASSTLEGTLTTQVTVGTSVATAATVTFTPVGGIDGIVTLAGGGSALGTVVAVLGTDKQSICDANGAYSLSGVPSGPQTLSLTAAGYGEQLVSAVFPYGISQALNLNFNPTLGSITGTALLNGLQDNSGIVVSLVGPTPRELVTTATGAINFSGLLPGVYTVTASAASTLERLESQQVTVTGSSASAAPTLPLPVMPDGGVVNDAGPAPGTDGGPTQPPDDGGVVVMQDGGASDGGDGCPIGTFMPDKDGGCVIVMPDPDGGGVMTMPDAGSVDGGSADDDGGSGNGNDGGIPAGNHVVFAFTPVGTVTGTVSLASGLPAIGAIVGDSVSGTTAMIGQAGNFQLTLPIETAQLTAVLAGYESASSNPIAIAYAQTAPVTPAPLVLTPVPPPGVIIGAAAPVGGVDLFGPVSASACLADGSTDNGSCSPVLGSANAASGSEFEIDGLPVGLMQLSLSAGPYHEKIPEVLAVAGTGLLIDPSTGLSPIGTIELEYGERLVQSTSASLGAVSPFGDLYTVLVNKTLSASCNGNPQASTCVTSAELELVVPAVTQPFEFGPVRFPASLSTLANGVFVPNESGAIWLSNYDVATGNYSLSFRGQSATPLPGTGNVAAPPPQIAFSLDGSEFAYAIGGGATAPVGPPLGPTPATAESGCGGAPGDSLVAMNLNTNSPQILAQDALGTTPVFTSDGGWLIYQSTAGFASASLTDGSIHCLGIADHYIVSSDNLTVALGSSNSNTLTTIGIDGSNATPISQTMSNWTAASSPSGDYLIFTERNPGNGSHSISLAPLTTGTVAPVPLGSKLQNISTISIDANGNDNPGSPFFELSADGQFVAFAVGGASGGTTPGVYLAQVGAAPNPQPVSSDALPVLDFSFAGDALLVREDDGSGINGELLAANAGANTVMLADAGVTAQPAASASGELLEYAVEDSAGGLAVWLTAPNGQGQRASPTIPASAGVSLSLDVAPDGTLAAITIAAENEDPPINEVFFVDPSAGAPSAIVPGGGYSAFHGYLGGGRAWVSLTAAPNSNVWSNYLATDTAGQISSVQLTNNGISGGVVIPDPAGTGVAFYDQAANLWWYSYAQSPQGTPILLGTNLVLATAPASGSGSTSPVIAETGQYTDLEPQAFSSDGSAILAIQGTGTSAPGTSVLVPLNGGPALYLLGSAVAAEFIGGSSTSVIGVRSQGTYTFQEGVYLAPDVLQTNSTPPLSGAGVR